MMDMFDVFATYSARGVSLQLTVILLGLVVLVAGCVTFSIAMVKRAATRILVITGVVSTIAAFSIALAMWSAIAVLDEGGSLSGAAATVAAGVLVSA